MRVQTLSAALLLCSVLAADITAPGGSLGVRHLSCKWDWANPSVSGKPKKCSCQEQGSGEATEPQQWTSLLCHYVIVASAGCSVLPKLTAVATRSRHSCDYAATS